jgi:hypothetical protein
MSNPILKQAVVIGAGMGGLAAAKAVVPHFEKVIVFERDALPDAPAPRLGTPQARHTHGLLAGGCRALECLFPGIEPDLVEAGAVRDAHAPRHALRGSGFRSFSAARPRLRTIRPVAPRAGARLPSPGRTGAEYRVQAALARDGGDCLARQSRGRGGALRGHARNAGKSRGGPGRRRLGASVANASLPRSDRLGEADDNRDRHGSGL